MANDPYEQTRVELSDRAASLVDEDELGELLGTITERASRDLADTLVEMSERYGVDPTAVLDGSDALNESNGNELLASVEAWASTASSLTYDMYVGPPREVGAARLRPPGWAKEVGNKLSDLAILLGGYLEVAMRALHASSFSISLNFPWGVAVGLSWG
jgi:hypothetical protein